MMGLLALLAVLTPTAVLRGIGRMAPRKVEQARHRLKRSFARLVSFEAFVMVSVPVILFSAIAPSN
jgi:hypothetical protein